MSTLQNKTETARAMFRAGNYKRVKEICREVLEKEETNLDAFEILFDTHMAQKDTAKALATCNWRLERVPDCVDAHRLKFLPLGQMNRKREAKALIESVRRRFNDRPFHLEQSEILFSHFFKSSRDTIWRLKKARETGNISDHWLDKIESYERANSGHIFTSQKLISESLERDPHNYDALFTLAVTRFYVGRLLSAIRLAKRAKRIKPQRAAECNEVIFASYVGLIPLFWGGQFFIIWVATVSTRIFVLLRGLVNVAGFIGGFIIQSFIFYPLRLLRGGDMQDTHFQIITLIIILSIIFQFLWMIYLLFGFQYIGRWLADRKKKNIKLSKKY